MFDKLVQLRDTLRTGAGKLADVVGKGKDALAELEGLLRAVEAGEVFALTGQQDAELHDLRLDFESIADDDALPGVTVTAPTAIPPGLAALIAQLAAELIKVWLEKRKARQQG